MVRSIVCVFKSVPKTIELRVKMPFISGCFLRQILALFHPHIVTYVVCYLDGISWLYCQPFQPRRNYERVLYIVDLNKDVLKPAAFLCKFYLENVTCLYFMIYYINCFAFVLVIKYVEMVSCGFFILIIHSLVIFPLFSFLSLVFLS